MIPPLTLLLLQGVFLCGRLIQKYLTDTDLASIGSRFLIQECPLLAKVAIPMLGVEGREAAIVDIRDDLSD